MQNLVILVLADLNESHESRGRVKNALQIAKEFTEAGDNVKVVFDGGGTASLAAILRPDHNMHGLYHEIVGGVVGACAFCAQAFHVKDDLEAAGVSLLDEYDQHPSIRSYIVNGYQVLTF